jgi:uncharacterized protein YutE (UPF0331/DUF86 family)
VVDRTVLAAKIAAVRDATARIRSVLPPSPDAFASDRTAREVVILNLLVAVQTCLDLAAHWLADEGWDVPPTYGDMFVILAEHHVIEHPLALKLAAAAGLRNLVAHQYGIVDWRRVHGIAARDLADLEAFCAALAARALPKE